RTGGARTDGGYLHRGGSRAVEPGPGGHHGADEHDGQYGPGHPAATPPRLGFTVDAQCGQVVVEVTHGVHVMREAVLRHSGPAALQGPLRPASLPPPREEATVPPVAAAGEWQIGERPRTAGQ